MPKESSKAKQPEKQHHYLRTLGAGFFGFLALNLIIWSILALWLNKTLTDTTEYVETVAPLASDADIQNFIVDEATKGIIEGGENSVRDLAPKILTNVPQSATDQQLTEQVRPIVSESVRKVVTSQTFINLWAKTNEMVHAQLINALENSSSQITLNFNPLIVSLIDELGETKLAFIKDELKVEPGVGKITFKAEGLEDVQRYYDYFKVSKFALIAGALLFGILSVLISVHHIKTLRRITLFTGIFTAVLAASLGATAVIEFGGGSELQQKAMLAVVGTLTSQLKTLLIIISAVCFGFVIASKGYEIWQSKKIKK